MEAHPKAERYSWAGADKRSSCWTPQSRGERFDTQTHRHRDKRHRHRQRHTHSIKDIVKKNPTNLELNHHTLWAMANERSSCWTPQFPGERFRTQTQTQTQTHTFNQRHHEEKPNKP